MPGKDGMETARIVRQNNKDMILIFVTAVEEYVFQAFDVGAFHYLVKPFSDDKFEEVVKRAIKTIGENSSNVDDEKYMMIQSAGSHIKVFCVSDMEKHIGEMEKLYQDIRSLRHDMGNHIQTLEHLVAFHNMDDATEYLEYLKKSGMRYLLR